MSRAWQTNVGTSRPRIFRLDSSIRPYAWGSVTAIPELLGQVPTGEPAAGCGSGPIRTNRPAGASTPTGLGWMS